MLILKFLSKIFDLSHSTIYVSGSALERILKHMSPNGYVLRVSFCNLSDAQLEKIVIDFHETVKNLHLNRQMHCVLQDRISNNLNFFRSTMQISDGICCTVFFEHFVPKRFGFSTNLLCLSKHGLAVPHEHKLGKKTFDLTTRAVQDIFQNTTQLLHDSNREIDTNDYFEIITEQMDLTNQNKRICKGVAVTQCENDQCCVCYAGNDAAMLFQLNCDHVFCAYCIDKHRSSLQLAQHEFCPICRTKIKFCISDFK